MELYNVKKPLLVAILIFLFILLEKAKAVDNNISTLDIVLNLNEKFVVDKFNKNLFFYKDGFINILDLNSNNLIKQIKVDGFEPCLGNPEPKPETGITCNTRIVGDTITSSNIIIIARNKKLIAIDGDNYNLITSFDLPAFVTSISVDQISKSVWLTYDENFVPEGAHLSSKSDKLSLIKDINKNEIETKSIEELKSFNSNQNYAVYNLKKNNLILISTGKINSNLVTKMLIIDPFSFSVKNTTDISVQDTPDIKQGYYFTLFNESDQLIYFRTASVLKIFNLNKLTITGSVNIDFSLRSRFTPDGGFSSINENLTEYYVPVTIDNLLLVFNKTTNKIKDVYILSSPLFVLANNNSNTLYVKGFSSDNSPIVYKITRDKNNLTKGFSYISALNEDIAGLEGLINDFKNKYSNTATDSTLELFEKLNLVDKTIKSLRRISNKKCNKRIKRLVTIDADETLNEISSLIFFSGICENFQFTIDPNCSEARTKLKDKITLISGALAIDINRDNMADFCTFNNK